MNLEELLLEIERKRVLETTLLEMFPQSRALVKILKATYGDEAWWDDHLCQLREPKTYRPVHHRYDDVYNNVCFNMLTGVREQHLRSDTRGGPKNTIYTKKTDVMLAHPEGKTDWYPGPKNTTDIYAIGLVYDIEKTDPTKPPKYNFKCYINTNGRPWKTPLPNASEQRNNLYQSVIKKEFQSMDEETFRAYSKSQEWIVAPSMRCVSKASVSGICISQDSLCNRMNAIHKQQLTKNELGKNLPIIFLPQKSNPDSKLKIYSAFEQLSDIFLTLEQKNNQPGDKVGKCFVEKIDVNSVMVEAFLRDGSRIKQNMINALVLFFLNRKDEKGLIFLMEFFKLPLSETRVSFNSSLVAFSEDIKIINTAKENLWHYAVTTKMNKFLVLLQDNEIGLLNARCSANRTALMLAIRLGYMTMVDILLMQAAKFDPQHARDALTQLFSLGEIERANILLERSPLPPAVPMQKYSAAKSAAFFREFFAWEDQARNNIVLEESIGVKAISGNIL